MSVYTFHWDFIEKTNVFEKYDFSGKKIILFAASGGSRWGNSVIR
ncbi:MAG: hypothetical protein IKF90_15245 [Parasporobacterium sp.]|nr:hypothetical protein [Parasporobacterium sp.]